MSFILLHLGEFSVVNGNSTVPKLGKPMAKREKNLLKRHVALQGGGEFPIVPLFWGVWVFLDLSMLSRHTESLGTFEGLCG